MHGHVCVWSYTHAHVYASAHAHTHTHTCICQIYTKAHINVSVFEVHAFLCVCVCVCVCMYVCVFIHTHADIHAFTHTHVYSDTQHYHHYDTPAPSGILCGGYQCSSERGVACHDFWQQRVPPAAAAAATCQHCHTPFLAYLSLSTPSLSPLLRSESPFFGRGGEGVRGLILFLSLLPPLLHSLLLMHANTLTLTFVNMHVHTRIRNIQT